MSWFRELRLRNKLLIMVMPLVVVPLVIVGGVIGTVASRQAYTGVTKTSRADLEHMALFTIDLLNSHYQQFQVYRADKKKTIRADLATLVNFATSQVEAQNFQYKQGKITLAEAQRQAAEAIKRVSVGQSGYAYVISPKGVLLVHIAREGENVYEEEDETGRQFIKEMCNSALRSEVGQVQHIVYPWKNQLLGDTKPRAKTVAYRYFKPWNWIVAVGGYLDETYEDLRFEDVSFNDLTERVKAKKVGETGYIYALDEDGTAVIHPFREGENLSDEVDGNGRHFIREMLEKQSGWIRYPWQNVNDAKPRMKIVRYEHFEPYNWIIAVGSYENEFFADADEVRYSVYRTTIVFTLGIGLVAVFMLLWASKVFTNPIERMTEVIRRVRGGQIGEKMEMDNYSDEIGELASAYNRMIELVRSHRGLEQELAQQGKMASLGVLSSAVAHEINNPLGVILGYAAYLEKKLDESDPNLQYISQIRQECKRCKKIVQDLLSYSRTPRPDFERVELNTLLGQIVEFAVNHPDMHGIQVGSSFDPEIGEIDADADQLRQIAINLILNAGAAMDGTGELSVTTMLEEGKVVITFTDTGPGISEEVREQIFEPFFTTRIKGTGLGLAITRQIVERHRGEIRVESVEGSGATFIITLPVNHEEF